MNNIKTIVWSLTPAQANQLKMMFSTAIESGKEILKQQIINKAPQSLQNEFSKAITINETYLLLLTETIKAAK